MLKNAVLKNSLNFCDGENLNMKLCYVQSKYWLSLNDFYLFFGPQIKSHAGKIERAFRFIARKLLC